MSGTAPTPTFARLVADRAADDAPALWFEEQCWTWREVVDEARRRAGLLDAVRVDGPWHVGLALENTAEHLFWWCAAALVGAGMLSVLLFPLLALRARTGLARPGSAHGDQEDAL